MRASRIARISCAGSTGDPSLGSVFVSSGSSVIDPPPYPSPLMGRETLLPVLLRTSATPHPCPRPHPPEDPDGPEHPALVDLHLLEADQLQESEEGHDHPPLGGEGLEQLQERSEERR